MMMEDAISLVTTFSDENEVSDLGALYSKESMPPTTR
jgi:hypothetical protein